MAPPRSFQQRVRPFCARLEQRAKSMSWSAGRLVHICSYLIRDWSLTGIPIEIEDWLRHEVPRHIMNCPLFTEPDPLLQLIFGKEAV